MKKMLVCAVSLLVLLSGCVSGHESVSMVAASEQSAGLSFEWM
ncbi:hypothetical protein [Cohnella sp. CFH 77786]|nr:hypothetical protein [Cohnella sp. CFH 77786]